MSTKPVVLISCRSGTVDWATSGEVDVFLVDTDCLDRGDELTGLPGTPAIKELVAKLSLQDHVEYVAPLVTPASDVKSEDVLSVRNLDDDRYIHAWLLGNGLVELYDGKGSFCELPKGKRGSYITAYRPKTLADRNPKEGLMLNAAFTGWSLSPDAVSEIVEWLRGKGAL